MLFDSKDLNVGVGLFLSSFQRGLARPVNRITRCDLIRNFRCKTLCFFVGDGLTRFHSLSAVDAGFSALAEGKNIGAQGRELLCDVGLQGRSCCRHADQRHDAETNDRNRERSAQQITSYRPHCDPHHFNEQLRFHVMRMYCLHLQPKEKRR